MFLMPIDLIIRVLSIFGLNSIPLLGWFGGEWSEGTVLAVYLLETLLMIFFIGVRIFLHRRMTGKSGHLRSPGSASVIDRLNESKNSDPNHFLLSYLKIMIPFVLVQGFLITIILYVFSDMEGMEDTAVSFDDLVKGISGMTFFLGLYFILDLIKLREMPFAWMKSVTEHSMGRVMVFQFAILVGLPLMAFMDQPRVFFMIFVGLKTLLDFSIYLPAYDPKEPPRWLCYLMDKIPGSGAGENGSGGFAAYWRADVEMQRELRAIDELPMPQAATPSLSNT